MWKIIITSAVWASIFFAYAGDHPYTTEEMAAQAAATIKANGHPRPKPLPRFWYWPHHHLLSDDPDDIVEM